MNKEERFHRLIHKISNGIKYIGLWVARLSFSSFKSSNTAQGPQGKVRLEYSLLEHSKKPNAFTLSFSDIPAESDVQVAMEKSFFHFVNIQTISPEPNSIKKSGKSVVYTFHPHKSPFSVQFNTTSNTIGCFPLEINIINGPSLHFYKYVCP